MSIERNEFFGREFQDRMLAHVVRHPRLLHLASSGKFRDEDFDLPIQRAVLRAALKVVKIQGHSRTGIPESVLFEQLTEMIRLGAVYQTEIQPLCVLVATIYAIDMAPDYFYGLVGEFTRHQRIHATLGDTSKYTVSELASRLGQVALETRIEDIKPINPLEECQLSSEPTICVPTGIGSIDTAMCGGLPLKEVGMLCAFTGVGKTTLGLNFLWGGANLGFGTRLATLELTGQKCSQRLYSNIADYDYNRILYGDQSITNPEAKKAHYEQVIQKEVWERVQRNALGKTRNMSIYDFSRRRCSMQALRDELHRDQDNCVKLEIPLPQMLYLDWLLMLDEDPGFDPRRLNEKEVRHKIQRYMNEFAQFVLDENLAGWIATQADQQAENKSLVTVKNAAEAKSSAWRVYLFAGLGMSEEDRALNPPRAWFNAAKARDLRHFNVPLLAQLDKQRFLEYPSANAIAAAEANAMCSNAMSDLMAASGNRSMTPVNAPA